MTSEIYETLQSLRDSRGAFVLVVVTATRGSTPQDAGAKMVVGTTGLIAGTVGGGKIEAAAIRHAQELLGSVKSGGKTETLEWNLQRDVGMTCGGAMTLYFEVERGADWTIALFGAGHVAGALIPVLGPLACRLIIRDSRPEWIAKVPKAPNLDAAVVEDLAGSVADLPDNAHVVLMTQGHATDLPILKRILETREFPFVGVIGSASKRATLERELREAGVAAERVGAFQCPLGLPVGTNHPHEIAISIAAGLLAARDGVSLGNARGHG